MISVIVPVYRTEKYLETCIKSVLAQDFSEYELILVDDGSPDSCPQICERYAASNPKIKVIHKENGGLSDARNAGLKSARGDYIFFLDADDAILPNTFSLVMDAIKKEKADMVIFQLVRCDDKLHPSGEELPCLQKGTYSAREMLGCFEKNIPALVTACSKLYRKELFDKLYFPCGKIHEDELICHFLIERCRRICVLDEKLYLYRDTPASIMNSLSPMKHSDVLWAYRDRIEILERFGLTNAKYNQMINFWNVFKGCYPVLLRADAQSKKRALEVKALFLSQYGELKRCPWLGQCEKIKMMLLKYLPGLYSGLYALVFNK